RRVRPTWAQSARGRGPAAPAEYGLSPRLRAKVMSSSTGRGGEKRCSNSRLNSCTRYTEAKRGASMQRRITVSLSEEARGPLMGRKDAAAGFPIEPPIEPMLAKLATELPAGDGWLFEPKWDGFRAIVFR